MLPPPALPRPCPNCGRHAAPGAHFCADCGAPLPVAPPSGSSWGMAVLGPVTGGLLVLGTFLVSFLAPAQRMPGEFTAWVRNAALALPLAALLGLVGLLPLFPGFVRGLGAGLLAGAALAALLLGLFQGCAQSLHNI